eukprot:scaffold3820_cov77-Skeletonema_dohrnii-CCMP3373.AAC.2
MERRDYHYYEANAADVNMEEITSSAENANTLQHLRDGDPTLNFFNLNLGRDDDEWGNFHVRQGDDMGWVGYFIGKSEYLLDLYIHYLPDGEEALAFAEGIARSQSIWYIGINNLSNDGFTAIVRVFYSMSQLEELVIIDNNSVSPDGWSELRTLLESGVCKLKQLRLDGNNYIGNEGVDVLSNGLRGIGSSLEVLEMRNNSIGNEGLLAVVEALQTCTSLEILDLSGNDFSSAAAGLASLSDLLRRDEANLKRLDLRHCRINDEGLQAFTQGAVIHCKRLDLRENESITTTGLSYLSNSIRSDSCCVEALFLRGTRIGDDGMKVLARGLAGNKSVRSLYLDDLNNDVMVDGWAAFSTALCDTSNVNSTYLSNHTICKVWLVGEDGEIISQPQDVYLYLQLNEQHPQYVARCKILMSHPHLDMTPFFSWDLKFLPLALAWFERAKQCTSLTIHGANSASRRRVLDESNDAFQSRALSAMYEFVRGMPMEVMKSREELILIAMAEEEIKMLREDVEQRDRKITQLEEENERLEEENERLLEDLANRHLAVVRLGIENERLKEETKRLSKIVVCVTNVTVAVFLSLAVILSLYLLSR